MPAQWDNLFGEKEDAAFCDDECCAGKESLCAGIKYVVAVCEGQYFLTTFVILSARSVFRRAVYCI